MKIILENVQKTIKRKNVLNDVNYTFESGKIYGLYGINGSGKTMLLRAIAGLIHINSGKITIDNQVLHKDMDFSPNTGVIIENMTLLPQHSAFENLKILSKIKKVASDDDIKQALISVGLEEQMNAPIVKDFSLGMRQKLNIAQAIYENQAIILLDEPTNGLDTESVKKTIAVLKRLRDEGKLIILASHISTDMERLADTLVHVDQGRIIVD